MIDLTLNLPTLVTLALAAIGAVAWLVRLEGRLATAAGQILRVEADLEEERRGRDQAIAGLNALITLLREQFHGYQLEVAKTYATRETIDSIKGEIVREIEKLEGQVRIEIDRVISSRPAPRAGPRAPRSGG